MAYTLPLTSHPTHLAPRGVALVVVMLILLVVSILGVGGAQIALFGERTARYDRDYLVASQAAEAALMDAEFDIRGPNTYKDSRTSQFVQGNTGIFTTGCGSGFTTRGLCHPSEDSAKPIWATVNFVVDGAGGNSTAEFGEFTGHHFEAGSGIRPALAPRYIIEDIEDRTPGSSAELGKVKTNYRVTAMGFGPRVDVQVVQQMVFRKEGS